MSTTKYLSCAETAKLLRQNLKATFPGVKFSVRSHTYAGGASIDVGWEDGPTEEQVKQVTGLYNGATFDGMIDLKSYHSSILVTADGEAQEVHFGADYIFTNRDVSANALAFWAQHAELNGRTRGGEQCRSCGTWMPEGDCYTANGPHGVEFACSPACAARITVRGTDLSAAVS